MLNLTALLNLSTLLNKDMRPDLLIKLINGFIDRRLISNSLHVKWSNFCNSSYNYAIFLPMLGHDLEMSCTKFHENRFRIDGEIDEKHALQIIVS